MEQTTTGAGAPATRPGFLTAICILSFIGSGLWALLSLIGIFASGWIMSILGGMMGGGMKSAPAMEGVSAEDMAAASAAVEGGMGMFGGMIIIIFVVSLIFAALSLFGVIKMWAQKKSGFILYVIPNGLCLLGSLISFDILMILITGGFIAMYAVNLKHMK